MKKEKHLPVVLVIDDEPVICEILKTMLEGKFKVFALQNGKEAVELIAKERVNLAFLDITMPNVDGLTLLRKIKEQNKDLPVIMATAMDNAKAVVEAMKQGACDYITKPFDVEEVISAACAALRESSRLTYFRSKRESIQFDSIVGKSKKIRGVYDVIEKVLDNDAIIFIYGESGTGKELIARAIHFNGARKHKPFIAVNCASIPENLLESELFGHEKGAFTDAVTQKLGMFELANGGTIFLDEISDLKLDMQAKLLRALEEREIRRLGGENVIKVDVRIISATNVNLKKAVEEGKFREDLYYRLNVVPVNIPPLRERKEDIKLLIDHFLKTYNKIFRKNISGLTGQVLARLTEYSWPGNIRELKNIIERIVALKGEGVIAIEDLPFDIFMENNLDGSSQKEGLLKEACNNFQKKYIEAVLVKAGGNQTEAARILGIHRNALLNKIKMLGLKE
jgi:DNA-binding NtrC family response regulator